MVAVPDFRNAMALLGGAVSVIATDGEAGRCGFTASARIDVLQPRLSPARGGLENAQRNASLIS
jgi:hypothetical protein